MSNVKKPKWPGRTHKTLERFYAERHGIKRQEQAAGRNGLPTHIRNSVAAFTRALARQDPGAIA
jgi:hypothetical protein